MLPITTNDLIRVFLPLVQQGLITLGYLDPLVIVKQKYQPTMQGTNVGPTVYFYKLGDVRYGFPQNISYWDSVANQETHLMVQCFKTTFQVSALVISVPTNTATYTASDLVNDVCMILQAENTLNALNLAGISILRVQDITNPYFIDDQDRYEASPSFDFTLTYQQVIKTIDPVVSSITNTIVGV